MEGASLSSAPRRTAVPLCPLPEATMEGRTFCVTLLVASLGARGAAALGDLFHLPGWYTIGAPCERKSLIEGEFLPNKTPDVASWK